MRLDGIKTAIDHTPFEPFLLRLSNGRTYPVRHPDNIIALPRYVAVGVTDEDGSREGYIVTIATEHISEIEPLAD